MSGIMVIVGTEQECQWVASTISYRVNFRIPAASGYADRLSPFFPSGDSLLSLAL